MPEHKRVTGHRMRVGETHAGAVLLTCDCGEEVEWPWRNPPSIEAVTMAWVEHMREVGEDGAVSALVDQIMGWRTASVVPDGEAHQ